MGRPRKGKGVFKKTTCRTTIQNVLNGSQNLSLRYCRLSFSYNTSICLEIIPKNERATELYTSSEMVYLGLSDNERYFFDLQA